MYRKLKKLLNNVLSLRAVSVLGPGTYSRYLARFVVLLPKIVARGDLGPLDEAMSGKAAAFNYRGARIHFDTGFSDRWVNDGTFAFGSVRELYIRDCYFRHLPEDTYAAARVVVDLGANRGAFSSLVARQAELLISVEASREFLPVIEHNMRLNKAANSIVRIGFVGQGGMSDAADRQHYCVEELLGAHGVQTMDLMKIDIEGSEYSIFSGSARWLDRVKAITMEVHPAYGDTGAIVALLERRGFTCVMATEDLERIDEPRRAGFVYAWKARAPLQPGPARP